ncbi:MAG TPA: alpha/beta hydrolase-fold protein [Longilinea sp.]|nr:alpha/beta hydrolase-fold protein [Longilinea sp.]
MTSFLAARTRQGGTPLIEDRRAIFLWLGANAPELMGDFSGWEAGTHIQLEELEPGVWSYTLALPNDAYIEYSFIDGDRRVLDSFNKRHTPNGIGNTNNFFYMPQGAKTPLARRDPAIPHGTVSRYTIVPQSLLDDAPARPVYLYQPSVKARVPLLVVWDGWDYFRRAALVTIIDNLIAQKRIQPVALALVQNGGRARSIEYNCSESTLAFLHEQVLPLARRELNLINVSRHPGAFAVMGASMGGLMAMYTAVRLPHIFGYVLSQSGAFFPEDEQESLLKALLDLKDQLPLKIWMDVGRFDFLLKENRSFHAFLNKRHYAHEYHEYAGGHNYPAWRDDAWQGLEYLFGA